MLYVKNVAPFTLKKYQFFTILKYSMLGQFLVESFSTRNSNAWYWTDKIHMNEGNSFHQYSCSYPFRSFGCFLLIHVVASVLVRCESNFLVCYSIILKSVCQGMIWHILLYIVSVIILSIIHWNLIMSAFALYEHPHSSYWFNYHFLLKDFISFANYVFFHVSLLPIWSSICMGYLNIIQRY